MQMKKLQLTGHSGMPIIKNEQIKSYPQRQCRQNKSVSLPERDAAGYQNNIQKSCYNGKKNEMIKLLVPVCSDKCKEYRNQKKQMKEENDSVANKCNPVQGLVWIWNIENNGF
jgi:hypothetical protein